MTWCKLKALSTHGQFLDNSYDNDDDDDEDDHNDDDNDLIKDNQHKQVVFLHI